jgi:predicted lipoprotein with Yx(FWY)xxD motif
MSDPTGHGRARRLPRAATILVAGLAGFALAAIGGIAAASSFTLKVEKNAHDTNAAFKSFAVRPVNKQESIAVGPSGYAVYTFQGETTHHIICQKTGSQSTNCWGFWPPVSAKSAKGVSAQTGVKGKLGTFRNHGTLQVTLNGQPLYYFTPDIMSGHKSTAQGDELKTFGSIWHLVAADPTISSGKTSSEPTVPTNSTTTTTNPYPPGYTY